MLALRGTKKLRDRVRGPVAGEDDASTGVLGDWFATALFWRPQVALLVNARTFLPVFTPLAPAGKLLDRVPDEIARILALHGVDPLVVGAELDAMRDARIAPTNDRSVLGVMNEFANLGEHWFDGDLTALSLRMAGTPVGPLRPGDGFPDLALAALVGRSPAPTDGLAEVIPFPGIDLPPTTAPPRVKARRSSSRIDAGSAARDAARSVFQLKVTLLNTKPPIWRRVLVDGSTTLAGLHEIIQAAFGWWNYHLHEFEIGRARYGIPDPDWDFGPPTTDESTTRLDAVAGEGTSFHYTYDFGDDWRHKVTVEKVGPTDPGAAVPDCIDGRRACPPEDCGGPWGYHDLLESLGGRPGSSDARLDFVGADFDPATFAPNDFALNLANVRNTTFDL
jgi:hypothetical protein